MTTRTPTTYVAAAPHAWMNEHGHGTYWTVGEPHKDRVDAATEGTRLAGGTDDFVIMEITPGGVLASVANAHGTPLHWSDAALTAFVRADGVDELLLRRQRPRWRTGAGE